MCPLAMPDVDFDLDSILHLDFEETVPCAVTDCNEEAKWWLVCGGCEVGRETVCQTHYLFYQEAIKIDPFITIIFDQTCGHGPYIAWCFWQPFLK